MNKILSMLLILSSFSLVGCGLKISTDNPDVSVPNTEENTPVVNKYTVTFNVVGGSEVSSITVNEGETISSPISPTKENYNFIEWRLNGVKFDFSTQINENIELVAIWEEQTELEKSITILNSSFTSYKFVSIMYYDEVDLYAKHTIIVEGNKAYKRSEIYRMTDNDESTIEYVGDLDMYAINNLDNTYDVYYKVETDDYVFEAGLSGDDLDNLFIGYSFDYQLEDFEYKEIDGEFVYISNENSGLNVIINLNDGVENITVLEYVIEGGGEGTKFTCDINSATVTLPIID